MTESPVAVSDRLVRQDFPERAPVLTDEVIAEALQAVGFPLAHPDPLADPAPREWAVA